VDFLAKVARFRWKGVRFQTAVVCAAATVRPPSRARVTRTQRVFVFLPSPRDFSLPIDW